jgi:UDP-N-acetylmuramoyl-L-alanyl-D-glutamate--2,6-diaminopimelate ligase
MAKERIFKDILQEVEISNIRGNLDIKVTGITSDSRNVYENMIFVAIKGYKDNGIKYVKSAIDNGAVAIVIDDDEDIDTIEEDIAIITVKNSRRELSRIARNFYDNPSEKLTVIGITGTKGKSTTTFMIKSILQASGKKVGLLRKHRWIYRRGKETKQYKNNT